jgi:hypothetical protein
LSKLEKPEKAGQWLISLEKSLAGCIKVEEAGEASTVWRKVEQTGEA